MAYTDRASGLSELARYGFSDLSSTVSKLDELVAKVGDSGRSAIASLGLSADPDQALNALLSLADLDKAQVKNLLKKPDSANRLCMLLGASSALTDFVRRYPEQLKLFEKPALLGSEADYKKRIVAAVEGHLKDGFQSTDAWNALRRAYRQELLSIAVFDVSQADPQLGQPLVAAALADIAAAALEAAIAIARFELKNSTEHGVFTKSEVDGTKFTVIAMGKCGARE